MTEIWNVFTAFGLSSSAGLNAYLPLLVVALLARFTDLIKLDDPWTALTNVWVIGLLVVLLVVETVADKVPAVDTINDTIQTFVRPVAGAILFAASSNVISDIHPALALACGLFVAGGVHAVKATARPLITATTAGVANPVVSTVEDAVALATSLVAVLAPMILALAMLLAAVTIAWWLRARQREREARARQPRDV
ncbi:MAG: DUF4126 domain-containing protein [Thermoflexales bacterium]|nr:DUF4126 domain-containing protein [Thermoflexales bacterium]